MDGGANICITGDLASLVGIVDIPPMAISVAINRTDITENDCCTKHGYTPLTCNDGSIYWQLCFFCTNVVKTIISPQAILASSNVFYSWIQTGFKDGWPGSIRFDSADGLVTMHIILDYLDGLYYCQNDVYTVDPIPHSNFDSLHVQPTACRVTKPVSPPSL
jgi:hypothetical protein